MSSYNEDVSLCGGGKLQVVDIVDGKPIRHKTVKIVSKYFFTGLALVNGFHSIVIRCSKQNSGAIKMQDPSALPEQVEPRQNATSPWRLAGWICAGVIALSVIACVILAAVRSNGLMQITVTALVALVVSLFHF